MANKKSIIKASKKDKMRTLSVLNKIKNKPLMADKLALADQILKEATFKEVSHS